MKEAWIATSLQLFHHHPAVRQAYHAYIADEIVGHRLAPMIVVENPPFIGDSPHGIALNLHGNHVTRGSRRRFNLVEVSALVVLMQE